MFPDFIIIGAMKCGTSSLYHYLGLHPQIGMSDIKEVDFFVAENNFDKGPEWYQAQFKGAYEVYGEASPNYSKAHYFKGVPGRMHDLLPGVRLIYLVRDPIERIISHYVHNYSEGREHRPIDKALQDFKQNNYLMCSKYYWQLQHYLKLYPDEQVLIMSSYRLKKERRQALREVFDFIGVDPSFYTREFEEQKHRSSQKRRKGRLSRLILESPVIRTLKGYIPDAVKDPVKKVTRPEVSRPQLSPGVRKRLQDELRPDVEKLRTLSGLPLDHWDI